MEERNKVVVESCSRRANGLVVGNTPTTTTNNYDYKTFGYRKLIVWQKAKQLVKLVYAEVKKLPPDERYALSDQIRRAVVSIPSNIAEGAGRASNRDYGHFLSIARGSLFETINQLEIAQDLGYATLTPAIETLAAEVGRMLTSLMKKYTLHLVVGESCSCREDGLVVGESCSRREDGLVVGDSCSEEGRSSNHHSTTTTTNYN